MAVGRVGEVVKLAWVGGLALWACADAPVRGEAPIGAPLAEFEGVFDPGARTLRIAPVTSGRGLAPLPVVKDGRPGETPPGTVELRTTRLGDGLAECGAVDTACGTVELVSGFAVPLHEVYAELTELHPPTGHEARNSDPPAHGLSARLGLWRYGDVPPGGRVARDWVFGNPRGTAFRFRGRLWGTPGAHRLRGDFAAAGGAMEGGGRRLEQSLGGGTGETTMQSPSYRFEGGFAARGGRR